MTRTLFPDKRLDHVMNVMVDVFIDNGAFVDDQTLFRDVFLGDRLEVSSKFEEKDLPKCHEIGGPPVRRSFCPWAGKRGSQ